MWIRDVNNYRPWKQMSAPTPYYLIISYETPQAGDITSVLLTKDNYSHYFPSPDLPLFLPLSIFASS